MAVPPTHGRVVVLNGASSAGKSTLARALQARWEAGGSCWVVYSWDDFVPRLPDRWRGVPEATGDRAADGCRYRVVREDPDVEALLEVGEIGRRMLAGYHRAVAAVARCGIDVIVEEVMITAAEWEDWLQALEGLDVCWIGVRCDLEVAERRETDRGDRYRGLARGTTLATHRFAVYDLEVDSSSTPADRLAEQITSRLR